MFLFDAGIGAPNFESKKAMSTPTPNFHVPVLLNEVVELLKPAPGRLFVDGTLGGGGHSEALLEAGANVIGLDQDPDALAFATKRLARLGERFHAVHANFAEINRVLDHLGIAQIDGALLDLGISSWQLEKPERGFSFMKEGPLDMRMDPVGSSMTAADLVNSASAEELERIFREFGEEPAARRVAARIVHERMEKKFETTLELARVVESAIPRRGKTHPATRIFQALRIALNRELDVLTQGLERFTARLRSGARFGVITFHSLEDRAVKTFFKQRSTELLDRPEWPSPRPNPDFVFKLVTRKAVVPGAAEQTQNPRSRSAKLRVVEKV